jgi:perosamine synthetase
MLRLSVPHLDESAITAATRVLRSGFLVHGEEGQAFEREIQDWLHVRHAVLVSSGTAALHLTLLAQGIGSGDAVLIPDFTFPATGNAVLLAGARPVLVDVDPNTYCMTPATLRAAVDAWRGPPRLRAVMPVHEFGCPVDMGGILEIARSHRLAIIEDAACALGACINETFAGTFGEAGCFSLHPRKTLTTGEGGIVVTNDEPLARRLRRLRSHGVERSPTGPLFLEAGLNYRLTDFQAALGRAQLPKLHEWIEARRRLAAQYAQALTPLASAGHLALPADRPGHSWQTFMAVLADGIDRSEVITHMAKQDVEVNLGAQCLSQQPAFAAFSPTTSGVASRLFRQGLALPFCEQYGVAEVERVVAALTSALEV